MTEVMESCGKGYRKQEATQPAPRERRSFPGPLVPHEDSPRGRCHLPERGPARHKASSSCLTGGVSVSLSYTIPGTPNVLETLVTQLPIHQA